MEDTASDADDDDGDYVAPAELLNDVGVFRTEPQKKDTMNMCKARHVYMLQGNVESCYLCRDGKTVATFERIFDVLLQVHQKLGHARDVIKNKDTNWRRITLE